MTLLNDAVEWLNLMPIDFQSEISALKVWSSDGDAARPDDGEVERVALGDPGAALSRLAVPGFTQVCTPPSIFQPWLGEQRLGGR